MPGKPGKCLSLDILKNRVDECVKEDLSVASPASKDQDVQGGFWKSCPGTGYGGCLLRSVSLLLSSIHTSQNARKPNMQGRTAQNVQMFLAQLENSPQRC